MGCNNVVILSPKQGDSNPIICLLNLKISTEILLRVILLYSVSGLFLTLLQRNTEAKIIPENL